MFIFRHSCQKSLQMMARVINRRVRNETPGVALFLIEQPQIVMAWAKETEYDEGVINCIGDLLYWMERWPREICS